MPTGECGQALILLSATCLLPSHPRPSLGWATFQTWVLSQGSPGSLQTSCLLKVTEMIKDDQTSMVTITLCPSPACPQFQLPHSGSINYYSNCFSQPTDLKLTACSSVLLHGWQREGWGWGGREVWIKWQETPESKKNFQKMKQISTYFSLSHLKRNMWFNLWPILIQLIVRTVFVDNKERSIK